MARIRSIKPEFFTSEDIVSLSPLARLLYIATWCEADREGRLEWKPNTLKMRYFPTTTEPIASLCDEVIGAGLVKLYGDGLAYIPTFKEHQVVNPREAQSRLPAPSEGEDARVTDASLRVSDAPSLPSPSIPFHSGGGAGGTIRPLIGKRNLRAAYEHPRFDVPDWWHLEKAKGLPDGEAGLVRFYEWLSERVERTNERTEPRKAWLNAAFEAWLTATAAPPKSRIPDVRDIMAHYAQKVATRE